MMNNMEFFKETGRNYQEAYDKIKDKYGPFFQVLNRRTISMGGFLGLFTSEGVEIEGYVKNQPIAAAKPKSIDREKEGFMKLAEERGVKVAKPDAIKEVLEEVKSLKEQMQSLPTAQATLHPGMQHLEEILERNDFSKAYIKGALEHLRKELSLQAMEDQEASERALLHYIIDTILIEEHVAHKGQIFVLVGPTGVGKTTTIAKLAASHGIGKDGEVKKKISLVTIDNYRIGAKVQIEAYGQIMGFPVHGASSYETLEEALAYSTTSDMVFVDTIGKSPKDYVKLAEMKTMLEACGPNASFHLAFSSTTKTSDIREIMNQFAPFQYGSCVMTKLDETSVVGNLISLLWEKKKKLSYITDGQSVPQDIHKANKRLLVRSLVGFSLDVSRFPIPGEEE
jgi:flagellar biosynthesis protein FlhF